MTHRLPISFSAASLAAMALALAMALQGADARAGLIQFHDPELDVEITLQDSRRGRPLLSIRDARGTDFSGLVDEINTEYEKRLPRGGIQVTEAGIFSSRLLLPGFRSRERFLVFRGTTSSPETPTAVLYTPIEYMVHRIRRGRTVFFFADGGGIRDGRSINFNRIDVDRIFSGEAAMDAGAPGR